MGCKPEDCNLSLTLAALFSNLAQSGRAYMVLIVKVTAKVPTCVLQSEGHESSLPPLWCTSCCSAPDQLPG